MSAPIAFKDIKAGDTIRSVVEFVVNDKASSHVTTSNGIYSKSFLEGQDALELVSRPIVLPELGGSVVRLAASGTGVTATWLLQHSGEWVSASGVRKTGPDFLRFVEQSGLTLEVIA